MSRNVVRELFDKYVCEKKKKKGYSPTSFSQWDDQGICTLLNIITRVFRNLQILFTGNLEISKNPGNFTVKHSYRAPIYYKHFW